MDVRSEILAIAKRAKRGSEALIQLSAEKRKELLYCIAKGLELHREQIFSANRVDLEEARCAQMSQALVDRLRLTEARFEDMVEGVRKVADLPEVVDQSMRAWQRPSGIEIEQRRVPIGVIGVIYESRPNVTVDAAVLCLKTANAVILRGGKEALHTNCALFDAMIEGGRSGGLPEGAIELVKTPDRQAVSVLLKQDQFVDLIIPRGGESLIHAVVNESTIPVIKHYKGVCHVYVDASADQELAQKLILNAKCQRPGVCNAVETLLVDAAIARKFLPLIAQKLAENSVEILGDRQVVEIIGGVELAKESDWSEEYLDLKLSIAVVDGVRGAIAHINRYGSRHSDAIIATDKLAQQLFQRDVDSSVVYVNTSTRFTDGYEFGFGAEIGISTDKIHARGPMGLEGLTTYKYLVVSEGVCRV